jgi:hypothetical protein
MMRTGPEALMVMARTMPHTGAEEVARLEYAYEDIRVVAAGLRAEALPDELPAAGGLILRALAWLRRAEAETDDWMPHERDEPATLAAMPAARAGAATEGAPTPLWGLPAAPRAARSRAP